MWRVIGARCRGSGPDGDRTTLYSSALADAAGNGLLEGEQSAGLIQDNALTSHSTKSDFTYQHIEEPAQASATGNRLHHRLHIASFWCTLTLLQL